jgi:hypothetical protein
MMNPVICILLLLLQDEIICEHETDEWQRWEVEETFHLENVEGTGHLEGVCISTLKSIKAKSDCETGRL